MTPAMRLLPFLLMVLLAGCASPEDKAAGYLAKARSLMAEENFALAKVQAKNAAQLQPKNAEAHLILAKIAWREGNFGEVFPQLQMAVESDPKLLEARLRLGDLLYAAGDVNGAAAQVAAAQQLAPESAEVHLLSGKVLFLQGDAKAALTEIDAALAANPAFVDAINGKAGLLSAQGDNPGALAVLDAGLASAKGADRETLQDMRLQFLLTTGQLAAYQTSLQELVKASPEGLKYRYQLLDLYAGQGRRDDEERLLRELADVDPQSARVKVRLANILLLKGDPAAAEKLLTDAITKIPENAELQIALGDFYRYLKRSADAMAAYRKVADRWDEATPAGLQARNRIVAQHVVEGRIKEARADIASILAAVPDNAEALLARATFAFADRQYEAAIADARAVIRRERSPGALLLLARCYLGVGDVVVARDTYRRLVADYPDNTEGARELALLLTDQGDAGAAEQVLRQFMKRNPGNSQLDASLVQTLLAQQDVGRASAEARRLLARSAGGEEQSQLAQVLQATGSGSEALSRYKAVLEQNPNQTAALQGLVRILTEAGRADEAIAYLERYPKDNLDASLLRGLVYAQQGDVKAARQVYEQIIAQQPAEGVAYVALARLSPLDSPEQIEALQRGWKANPGDVRVGMFLASIDEREGNTDLAIERYEAMLKRFPADPFVLNNLAALLIDNRTDAKSLARGLELAKLLAAANDPISLDTLGWAYYRNADYPNAVRFLERAVAASAINPLLRYHLGKAYQANGNAGAAAKEMRRALEQGGSSAAFAADARTVLAKVKPAEPLVEPEEP